MRTTTVVIGAGHAGLAISHFLAARSIDHVVIERGEVANTWRTERWDSLRLLTPNWQTTLPGFAYADADPDGFMSMEDVIQFVSSYAKLIEAPLQLQTTVTALRRGPYGYDAATDRGTWQAPTVVIASGGFNLPNIPAVAAGVPETVDQVTPQRYRGPDRLADGPVLVVGASATGIQIADEVQASGRSVTLATGEHVRMPRVYRGMDVQWWMDRTGRLDERIEDVDDLVRARSVPSPQLVGTPERLTLDLNAVQDRGVTLAGRLAGVVEGTAQLSGSLRNVCNLADLKQQRLLEMFDEWATENGMDADIGPPQRYPDTRVPDGPALNLDLRKFGTILWATGFRPDYSWLDLPVLDRKGQLRHDGGIVTGAPGVYRIGLNFLRRRKSSFIHGAEDDARDIVDHLAGYLADASAL